MTTTNNLLADAKIYVGTYAKYNNGSIDGAWLDLADYSSKDEFLTACAELHSNEADPELMFQDFEGFPKELYSESSLFDFWELAEELENNNIDDFELYADFCNHFGYDLKDSFSEFAEAYCGEQSESDFAYDMAQEMYGDAMDAISGYFNYDQWERDLFMCDYTSISGHIFRNI